jgi:threonine dehydrogenase-like Zn-dependent dehydrogenase
MLRALVGQFEIDNIEGHLRHLGTGSATPPVELGALAIAWPRVQSCSTSEEIRDVLRLSSWGDPGGADPVAVAVGLAISWARRLRRLVPGAGEWGLGAAMLVVAREQFVFGRELNATTAREVDLLVGRRWRSASTLDELVSLLGPQARWVFAGVTTPSDLWRSERDWWMRVETDAMAMIDNPRPNGEAVAGAVALMLVDLRRVQAAIETVGRGPAAVEVFDDVA